MPVSGTYILVFCVAYLRSITSFVQTRSGPVEGVLDNYHRSSVDVYLGIPYAVPPVGQLRFRRTVPVQPWIAPLKANKYPPACVQYFPFKYPWVDWELGQSEDCLYLNIWAPRSRTYSMNKKAVMFWMYGGGYSTGSNRIETYDGGVLAAEGDVIVVTVNYRVGVFGFLSTSNEEALGNMGLYDTLEALRWVKRNIRSFGGDPDNITIFGESGGALTAGIFCVSPLATGLFKRVILESAAPTRLIEDASYERNIELATRLAAEVGCAPSSAALEQYPGGVIQCLRNKDARILAFSTAALSNFSVITFDYIYGDALLPRNPRVAILELQFQNVDVLIGNNQDEGSFRLTSFLPELFGPFGEKNPRINKTFGSDLIRMQFNSFPSPEAVVEWYLGWLHENDYDYVRSQVYHSLGDYALFCPDVYFAESFARKGNSVYFYYFNHRPSVTPWAPWMGVAHADEVPFVFGRPFDCITKREIPFGFEGPLECIAHYSFLEKILSKKMIKMWTNFAKYGKPSHEWPTFSRERPHVLTFQTQGQHRKSYLLQHFENCDFFRPFFGFS